MLKYTLARVYPTSRSIFVKCMTCEVAIFFFGYITWETRPNPFSMGVGIFFSVTNFIELVRSRNKTKLNEQTKFEANNTLTITNVSYCFIERDWNLEEVKQTDKKVQKTCDHM